MACLRDVPAQADSNAVQGLHSFDSRSNESRLSVCFQQVVHQA